MVSVLGAIIIVSYVLALLIFLVLGHIKEFERIMLSLSILICIFIGFGSTVGVLTYPTTAMLLYDFTAIVNLAFHKKKVVISKSSFNSALVLLITLFLSFLNLIINRDMPMVILMKTSMDNVYRGLGTAQKAIWSNSNIYAIFDMLLMVIGLILAKPHFTDLHMRQKILANVRAAYHVFFVIVTFEFFVNNLISPNLLRNIVFSLIGRFDMGKAWVAENRLGFYGVTGLFPEQSYVTVMLIYASIVYVQGINSTKENIFCLYGFVVTMMFGCTSSFVVIPLLFLAYVKGYFGCTNVKNRVNLRLRRFVFIGAISIVTGAIIAVSIKYLSIYDSLLKLKAYIYGGTYNTSSESSGAIRNLGNQFAYGAFLNSPLFGVGLGTTRGFGIMPGMLACFGITGVIAYFYFLHTVFNFSLKKKRILFYVLVLYATTVLSVWYLYYFALIPIYLIFGTASCNDGSIAIQDGKNNVPR